MAISHTIEQLSHLVTDRDTFRVGVSAVSAAFRFYGREVAATRADMQDMSWEPEVVPKRSDEGNYVAIIRVGLLQSPQRVCDAIDPLLADLHFGPRYYMRSSPNDEANKEKRLEIVQQEQGRDVKDELRSILQAASDSE